MAQPELAQSGGVALKQKGFQMGDLISTGGFSWVYQCQSGAKEYAAKIQKIEEQIEEQIGNGYGKSTELATFKNEVHILNMLTCFIPENVPQMRFTFTAYFPDVKKHLGVIIMDKWDGGLHKLVRIIAERHVDNRIIITNKLLCYGTQVVEMLLKIQRLGITHYDAKPSNILFRGDPGYSKICDVVDLAISDFGHAHDYLMRRGYGDFRSEIDQPSNYDVAMFQFCYRAEAASNNLPYRKLRFLPNAEYISLVKKHALKDEWLIPRWTPQIWAEREKKLFS